LDFRFPGTLTVLYFVAPLTRAVFSEQKSRKKICLMPEYRARMFTLVITVIFVAIFSSVAQTAATSITPPYRTPSLPMTARDEDLVARMTLEEKARAIPRLLVPAYD
jgi:hypothetical protein